MEDTPMNLVSIAVEVMIAMAVLGFIGYALFIGTTMIRNYQREADIANSMAEYALYSKYDDTILTGSDLVEAVYMYAEGGFRIVTPHGTWGNGVVAPAQLTGFAGVNLSGSYRATLIIENGRIAGINFIFS